MADRRLREELFEKVRGLHAAAARLSFEWTMVWLSLMAMA